MQKVLKYLLLLSVTIFVAVILLLSFDRAHFVFSKLIYPVQHFFYRQSVAIKDVYDNWGDINKVKDENQTLKEKNIQLELANSNLKEDAVENEYLRKELSFFKENNYDYLIGDIIGKSLSSYEQLLFVNKGSLDNVRTGDPVIINDGILIGKIYKVYKTYSMILLVIDNNSAVAATVQNNDKTVGIINGVYGLSMRMDFIPQTEETTIGDKVISSGLERYVPRGLLIGMIDDIHYKQGELFKSATIKPLVDFNKITIVTILHVQEE